MEDPTSVATSREQWRRQRAEAIERFLDEFAPGENADLLFQMIVTVCRLAADETDRGDLKILNSALKELRYAFKVFRPFAGIRKVSMFGSARTPEGHSQYLEAKKFAELIQANGWMVITGAGNGIMRAGHHGATRDASFGVAISLPFEQSANTIIADDPKLVNFRYFFTRKLVFVKEANAIALFPGGFGTQDEGFESLTLVQTMKAEPTPIVMCDEPNGQYWQHWRDYVGSELLGTGMVDPADMELFYVADRAEAAVAEILQFYRRFHSSRYVGDKLAIRLEAPLAAETLTEINDTFADILREGRFEQVPGPLEDEDGALPHMHRLVFAFNRRSAGRLRLLINRINEEE